MKTLFNPIVNEEILERIGKLNASSQPEWGKMNVTQMLAHLSLSLQINFGEIELKRGFLGLFFSGISRRILLSTKPFPRHLPADKKAISTEVFGFTEERLRTENLIKRYLADGVKGLSKKPHNILGKISPEESSFLSYKHLDHHLRQFGV